MARKKLQPFLADDAGDAFTPTVKSIEGGTLTGQLEEPVDEEAKNEQNKKDINSLSAAKEWEDQSLAEKCEVKSKVKFEKAEVVGDIEIVADKGDSEQEGVEVSVELVGFALGDEKFGFDIQKIQEINRLLEITQVPRTPDFVMGVINLRGIVIPIIDLRIRFGRSPREPDQKTRIIVVEVKGKTIGMLVDAVSEVLRIPVNTIEPPPEIISGLDAQYISGVAKFNDQLIIILDLDMVLIKEDIGRLEETG